MNFQLFSFRPRSSSPQPFRLRFKEIVFDIQRDGWSQMSPWKWIISAIASLFSSTRSSLWACEFRRILKIRLFLLKFLSSSQESQFSELNFISWYDKAFIRHAISVYHENMLWTSWLLGKLLPPAYPQSHTSSIAVKGGILTDLTYHKTIIIQFLWKLVPRRKSCAHLSQPLP